MTQTKLDIAQIEDSEFLVFTETTIDFCIAYDL